MIALKDSQPHEPTCIPERIREFFQAGGVLEKACLHEDFPFEARPQQTTMAAAVAEAILAPAHLAVEAGTGVGKTFAYLVPLILLAREREMPVAVSTQTINLQEQIVSKDIPFLQRHMGMEFKVTLCKGRQNYLCLRRLARARQMSGDLFHKAQERDLDRIRRWADITEDGSLSDWGQGGRAAGPQGGEGQRSEINVPLPSSDVWGQVCSEPDNCLGRKCPHGERCFLMRARRQAFEADILVLNHHLFFSDLALRQDPLSAGAGSAGFLPEFKTIVFDEAHGLEDTAGDHLGLRLSQAGVEHWLRRLYVPESGKGLLAALKESELAHAVAGLWEHTEQFFLEIEQWAALSGKASRRVVKTPLELSMSLGVRLTSAIHQVERRIQNQEDPDVQAELNAIIRRGLAIRDSLDLFLNQSQANCVYWVEREGVRRKQFVLYSAPIEVGPILETLLFGQFTSVILTSATLAVSPASGEQHNVVIDSDVQQLWSAQATLALSDREAMVSRDKAVASLPHSKTSSGATGRLAYFRKRVGAVDCRELVVGSPFDYNRQMRVYVAGDMPEPADEKAFGEAAAGAISLFVRKSRGRAFVLFTSAGMMESVARVLEPFFEAEGIMLLVQGAGLSRHAMLERFRRVNEQAGMPDLRELPDAAAVRSAVHPPPSALHRSAVLFGLASFWMGVDVRGEALSNVIIVRLPFAVPDEPVTRARMDRIREQGGNPFRDYSLPEAILRFRQGVGRLIRTATDEGMIAILDPRVIGKWYGRHFLNAIPDCPLEVVSINS